MIIDDKTIEQERLHLVYIVRRRDDGRYVQLNRHHSGIGSRAWVDYNKLPGIELDLSPSDAARISFNGSRDAKIVVIYNDGCKPWDNRENRADYWRRHDYLLECIERSRAGGSTRDATAQRDKLPA